MAAGDVALREAERAYELSRTPENLSVLNRERRRRGLAPVDLPPETLAVLSAAGDSQAYETGGPGRSFSTLTTPESAQIVTNYLRHLRYGTDRWGNLVSQDGTRRFKFKARVVEEYTGRSGHWRKERSLSTIGFAMSLWAQARDLAGLEGEVIREKRKKEKSKRAERATKEQAARLAIRLATIQLSAELTPDQRGQQLFGTERALREHVDGEAMRLGPQVAGASEEKIDALLSIDSPPVFVLPATRREYGKYPTSYMWVDPAVGEIKFRLADASLIAINMGHIPVDPVTGSFSPTLGSLLDWSEGERAGGLAAKIYRDQQGAFPALFMFTPNNYEHAVALIRAFCRLLQAYDFELFTIEGVTDQEAAILRQLHDAEVITLLKGRSRIYARCDLALEDPAQRRMFGPAKSLERS